MTEAADNPQQAKHAEPQRPETEEAVSFGFEQCRLRKRPVA